MPLTNLQIQAARPSNKPWKLFDQKGLYLLIQPSGGKWWRFKYRFNGREKLLALGTYPEIGLATARELRDEARSLVARDTDPSAVRRALKTSRAEVAKNTFISVATEWIAKKSSTWSSGHTSRVRKSLESDIYPLVGSRSISELKAGDFLHAVRRIEDRGAVETAHRALSNCSQIMRFAVQTQRAEFDPCLNLRGALPPVKVKHLSAVTDPSMVGPLLQKLGSYQGTATVRAALKLAPLVFVRPGELRSAKWENMDLENCEWRFRVSKTNTDHIVPLSRQAGEILRDLKAFNGQSIFVFPGARTVKKPMSENALLAALRNLDIPKEEMSGHGFRAMARTILEEVLGYRPEVIELQLAHAVRDPLGRAYNRTTHLPARHEMMQAWADWLDKKLDEAKINGK
jgi:integrase